MTFIFEEDRNSTPRFKRVANVTTLKEVHELILELNQTKEKDYKVIFELCPDGDLVGVLEEE